MSAEAIAIAEVGVALGRAGAVDPDSCMAPRGSRALGDHYGGRHVGRLVRTIGLPDGDHAVRRRLYVWEVAGSYSLTFPSTHDAPSTTCSTRSAGWRAIRTRARHRGRTRREYSYQCRITVEVSRAGRVEGWNVYGNSSGCYAYRGLLEGRLRPRVRRRP